METQPQQPAQQIQSLSPAQRVNAKRLLFRGELEKRAKMFTELLPAHLPFKKFMGGVIQHMLLNPNLFNCSAQSMLQAAFNCARLGLMPDSYSGEAYIIPFYNYNKNITEAQFIPGYRGLVQLAMRTGTVKRFQARAVFKGDEFTYSFGTNESITHIPKGLSAEPTHFYAIIEQTNGGIMFDVMTVSEVEIVRNASPNWKGTKADDRKNTIWFKHFVEMAKKTVIRRLSKYAPVSPEFQLAVGLEEQVEVIGEGQNITIDDIDFEELSHEDQEKRLTDILNENNAKEKMQAGFVKPANQSERAANLMAQTEAMLNDKK